MAFTADELNDINVGALENYIDKGKVWKQNVANKPLLEAFDKAAGRFSGGKDYVSVAVKSGQGGGSLVGYSQDDQVGYYNPTGRKRARSPWKEHHIGIVVTHTELKIDGIDVVSDSETNETRPMDGREATALVNLLDEKLDDLGEDYAFSLNRLIHGDGSADPKALAGILSILSDNPTVGTALNINRATNLWWRNDYRTTAGGNAVTSNTANGGALIEAMDQAARIRSKYRNGGTKIRYFAGAAFIDAYKKELRANGNYTLNGWRDGKPDGSMEDPMVAGIPLEWDPTMDDLGFTKRCYAIDFGKTGLKLLYMDGQRMKKHHPDRPYDRYVMYNGITTTAVMMAKQLNTSGVYEIA